jgi:hypothetical protein
MHRRRDVELNEKRKSAQRNANREQADHQCHGLSEGGAMRCRVNSDDRKE